MAKIRILIADDHRMFQAGIAILLKNEPGFEIIGEASDGKEAVRLALQLSPDVILMDIDLPVLDGIAATHQITTEKPTLKILVLTSFSEEGYVLKMLKAGAKGYILKDAPFDELVLAIRAVAKGGSYFTREISTKLFARLHEADQLTATHARDEKLVVTSREMEVLQYVAAELTNKEIAAKLFISPRTVETHRRNLIQKLKLKNTAGLVKYYLEHLKGNGGLAER